MIIQVTVLMFPINNFSEWLIFVLHEWLFMQHSKAKLKKIEEISRGSQQSKNAYKGITTGTKVHHKILYSGLICKNWLQKQYMHLTQSTNY